MYSYLYVRIMSESGVTLSDKASTWTVTKCNNKPQTTLGPPLNLRVNTVLRRVVRAKIAVRAISVYICISIYSKPESYACIHSLPYWLTTSTSTKLENWYHAIVFSFPSRLRTKSTPRISSSDPSGNRFLYRRTNGPNRIWRQDGITFTYLLSRA